MPVIAKLTPNVTDIARIARAAEAGGCDAVAVINTCLGMAVNWRRRRSQLGRMMGGLSGPAIKPIALRAVFQVAQAVKIPIVGIGGIATIDDVMDFLVTGATAVQIGTANFYNPTVSMQILDALPAAAARTRRRIGRRGRGNARRVTRIRHPSSFILSIMPRVLSGIQPTGRFHWGNYFGAIRQYIDLQDKPETAFYFIADLHALTTVRNAGGVAGLHARRGARLVGPGARSESGLAVPAIRRARGRPTLLDPAQRRPRWACWSDAWPTRTRRPAASAPTPGCSPIPCSWRPTS